MTRKELIELLSHPSYNDDDKVIIESYTECDCGTFFDDFEIKDVGKDGKGDICLEKGDKI
ncbi:hypothetical protein Slash_8 [Bacillus phage Slash]|uniref:Uncharacterized protein n=2 Tax=Slashvirus TaxID=1921709 RepID=U5Q043_9CAUD|nr:hypothetical protein Staley_8 [Bacillus phage Staley]YP_008771910.1 hypothetical protein Slash_8 [Bacillus phage Slash]AGY48297.1 hypothetical protein Slash_8 [Bacillus phage Slash]AGY48691.1 hypothetical protein Staley_8 [Bacillus phage Staley]